MYILGINAYHADVSAVLIRDGELIAAVEEERFRRVKHWAGFPSLAIGKCLEIAGIAGGDVGHVAISRDPRANLLRRAAFVLRKPPAASLLRDRLKNVRSLRNISEPLAQSLAIPAGSLPKVHYIEHHPAHMASAYFVSPFDDAAICAIDGFGDFVSTSLAVGRGPRMEMLDRVFFPHSLGMLYTAVTQYLGFESFGDEFKVMGLAPYGEPEFVPQIRRLVKLLPKGRFKLDLSYFRHHTEDIGLVWDKGFPSFGRVYSPELARLLGPARHPGEELAPRHENIACSLQQVYEECAFHILNGLWERTHNPRLCLAGGCAMNSVANGKVRQHTPFTELFIQPAAADNGTALGAAYYVWHQVLGQQRTFVMKHAYWGTSYSGAAIAGAVAAREDREWIYRLDRVSDEHELYRRVAALIAAGQVIGWYQGCMEWGARALGNRSILADPRRADMRELINTRIKFREKFRPFAPSVLEEAVNEYFVDAAADPFMAQVFVVRADKAGVIPAVTHVDGTARVHTVNAGANPPFHGLISAFGELTGVPMLLNTSFNENEPIVDTPAQALDCFLRTRMDGLVINDMLIEREPRAGRSG